MDICVSQVQELLVCVDASPFPGYFPSFQPFRFFRGVSPKFPSYHLQILPFVSHPTNPGMSKERDPFLFSSDGIGTRKILFDREGSGRIKALVGDDGV